MYCEVDRLAVEIDPGELTAAGLFVRTSSPRGVDSEVDVLVRIGQFQFEACGHVVQCVSSDLARRTKRSPGYALLFTHVDDRARAQLRAAIESRPAAGARHGAVEIDAVAERSSARRGAESNRASREPMRHAVAVERVQSQSPTRRSAVESPPGQRSAMRHSAVAVEPVQSQSPTRRSAVEVASAQQQRAPASRNDAVDKESARSSARPAQPAAQLGAAIDNLAPGPSSMLRSTPARAPGSSPRPPKPSPSPRPAARANSIAPPRSAPPAKRARNSTPAKPLRTTAPPNDPKEQELLIKLQAELAGLQSKPAWTVLGISQGADVATARAAFFEASKRCHPHLYARYALPPIKDTVTELFIAYKRAFTAMTKTVRSPGGVASMATPAAQSGRPIGRTTDPGNK